MRILICGGREFADENLFHASLDVLPLEQPVSEVIHGAARGADSLAAAWARSRDIPTLPFPADWKKHGKAAGFLRNATMLREGRPDLVVAFPGGKGTAHMVKLARAAGIPVHQVAPLATSRDGGRP